MATYWRETFVIDTVGILFSLFLRRFKIISLNRITGLKTEDFTSRTWSLNPHTYKSCNADSHFELMCMHCHSFCAVRGHLKGRKYMLY